MDSGEAKLPAWADESADDDDALVAADGYGSREGGYLFDSSRLREFELDHAEQRLHRPCSGCGRFPLGGRDPIEVYSTQQREQWDKCHCPACYAIWQCSLVLKRDVVRVSGDVVWFSGIEGDAGLKIRLYNEFERKGDIVPQFGFARHIAPRGDSEESLKCAKVWLTSCTQTHLACRSQRQMSTLPTRVIDVSLPDPQLVYAGSVSFAPYAALSHCWGAVQPLRTLTCNIESHSKGISPLLMPRTFHDAIRVTRYLNIRYLWIDSLCIVQDDDDDWNREAAKMAVYYTGAEIVISASSSQGSSEGFTGLRRESVKGTLLIGEGHDMPSKKAPLHFREATVGDSGSIPRQIGYRVDSLSSRGWCFQERLLARRLLSFDSEQLIWECNSACHCEGSDTSNPDLGLSTANVGDSHDHDYNMSARLSGASKAETFYFWRTKVIQHYASRNLTRKTDRLIAVQGIVDVLRERLNDEYIHGLWKGDVLEGLTWSTQATSSVGVPLDVAPTWSWASVYGPVKYSNWPTRIWTAEVLGFAPLGDSTLRLFDNTPRLRIQLRGQLFAAGMEFLDETRPPRLILDASSGLSSGLSVVEAYLDTPCEVVLAEDLTGRAVRTANRVGVHHLQATDRGAHPISTQDSQDPPRVWLLRLFSSNKQQRYTLFLVLGASRATPGCFERIGTSPITPKTDDEHVIFESYLRNEPVCEVSII
ncbi:heterokaryon incompatibility protein-domain-containing protein [Xylaria palmicola]|nr:heterokaryon incompatibility protein-domain-containing protein [Xylaria palmicola]